MSANNLMKDIKAFAAKVKRISNLMTVVLIASIAYTMSQWQRAMDIDNLSNVLVMILVMAINIRFYKMYINISDLENEAAYAIIEGIYKSEKREYDQLQRISIWIAFILVIVRLVLN